MNGGTCFPDATNGFTCSCDPYYTGYNCETPNDGRYINTMDLGARKHVFGGSDQDMPKPACSATKTSWNIKISLVLGLVKIFSKERITKALFGLHGCTCWSALLLFANLEAECQNRLIIEISLVASLDMILSKERISKALFRLH